VPKRFIKNKYYFNKKSKLNTHVYIKFGPLAFFYVYWVSLTSLFTRLTILPK